MDLHSIPAVTDYLRPPVLNVNNEWMNEYIDVGKYIQNIAHDSKILFLSMLLCNNARHFKVVC